MPRLSLGYSALTEVTGRNIMRTCIAWNEAGIQSFCKGSTEYSVVCVCVHMKKGSAMITESHDIGVTLTEAVGLFVSAAQERNCCNGILNLKLEFPTTTIPSKPLYYLIKT